MANGLLCYAGSLVLSSGACGAPAEAWCGVALAVLRARVVPPGMPPLPLVLGASKGTERSGGGKAGAAGARGGAGAAGAGAGNARAAGVRGAAGAAGAGAGNAGVAAAGATVAAEGMGGADTGAGAAGVAPAGPFKPYLLQGGALRVLLHVLNQRPPGMKSNKGAAHGCLTKGFE